MTLVVLKIGSCDKHKSKTNLKIARMTLKVGGGDGMTLERNMNSLYTVTILPSVVFFVCAVKCAIFC